MREFPDESQYPLAQDGIEPIRPDCSVGINYLLGQLKRWSESDAAPRFGMLLLNVFTIVRNIWFKDIKVDQVVAACNCEMDMFTTYLEAYLEKVATGNYQLPVVLYYPSYEAIPRELRRKPSPAYERFQGGYDILIKGMSMHSPPKLIHRGYRTHRWIVPCPPIRLPRYTLGQWIRLSVKNGTLPTFKLGDNIYMMTGNPIDLHLCTDFPNVKLWEYYTGTVKDPKDFGSKLNVPKEVSIPFSIFTHRVFGDKVNIQGIVYDKGRTNLLKKISPNKWKMVSDRIKMEDLQSVGITADYKTLTSYKF